MLSVYGRYALNASSDEFITTDNGDNFIKYLQNLG
jgi:hypothetical protein